MLLPPAGIDRKSPSLVEQGFTAAGGYIGIRAFRAPGRMLGMRVASKGQDELVRGRESTFLSAVLVELHLSCWHVSGRNEGM